MELKILYRDQEDDIEAITTINCCTDCPHFYPKWKDADYYHSYCRFDGKEEEWRIMDGLEEGISPGCPLEDYVPGHTQYDKEYIPDYGKLVMKEIKHA